MNAITRSRQRFRAWARRHVYSFFSSLGALLSNRVGTLMTVLVLGIAIVLPLGLHLTLENLDRMELREEEWGALTVFLAEESPEDRASQLAAQLEQREDVDGVELISPEQGLAEFQQSAGFGASLNLLESNPLPWVISVTPAPGAEGELEAAVVVLTDWLRQQDGVASVQYDRKWLERLGRILDLGQAAVTVLIVLFALAVVVVVSNTIRLDVASRSEEIEVLALVGAHNSFIRQPFLYTGFWYGLLGGVVAMVLINLSLLYLGGPLGRLLASYGEQADLVGPGLTQTLLLLLSSGILGWLGALIAVQRHLRKLAVGGTLGRR